MPEVNSLKVEFQEKVFTEVKADALALLLTKDDLLEKLGTIESCRVPWQNPFSFRENKNQIEASLKGSDFTRKTQSGIQHDAC